MSYRASPTHEQSCPGDAMGTQSRLLTPKDWQPKQAKPGETVCWMRHTRVACRHMVVILPPSARTQGNSACFGAARGAVTLTTASALTLLLCFDHFPTVPKRPQPSNRAFLLLKTLSHFTAHICRTFSFQRGKSTAGYKVQGIYKKSRSL